MYDDILVDRNIRLSTCVFILCEALNALGYKEIVVSYHLVPKWYA